MKSTAHIKGHPVHPILVSFPIAFFTGTLIFDVLGCIANNSTFWLIGGYLEIAGMIAGLLAAVPGAIDFFFTVPPRSSAKSRGLKHALINIGMLLLFGIAYINRHHEFSLMSIILEGAGIILMFIAGWLGGTLVVRNQIGINPRYAGAGKWKEARFRQAKGLVEVATVKDLQTDQMKLIHLNNKRIVLAKTADAYVAFNDRCTHKGGSLAGGAMICGTVQCPWHGSQFDVNTGAVKAGPATAGIIVYPVLEKEGKVYLDLDHFL
jgi:nitrite reductase/ring-hydroxylating ferredoxin subunit/uncharacterized membrane protein